MLSFSFMLSVGVDNVSESGDFFDGGCDNGFFGAFFGASSSLLFYASLQVHLSSLLSIFCKCHIVSLINNRFLCKSITKFYPLFHSFELLVLQLVERLEAEKLLDVVILLLGVGVLL